MKQIIRDYLTFNKRERNGVFVLLSIIALMLLYLNVSTYFFTEEKVDVTKFIKEIDSMQALVEPNDFAEKIESDETESIHIKAATAKVERFNFDPNGLSEQDWMRLGFSAKQIKTIKNYEAKGGKFKKKEDLKKMYCIKEDLYNSLERYIQIPVLQSTFENGKVESPQPVKPANPSVIELNSADSATLTTLKGIGPFFAKNIIKHRNSLGGYHSKEQLMEVWKFDKEKYETIERLVTVDPSRIKKININTCDAAGLKNPYLSWTVANAIVNYRKQHGKFKTIEEIKLTDLVDDETLRKIAPYLIVEF
jgi:DNA uptake protein ComE-like DNA-binding protein